MVFMNQFSYLGEHHLVFRDVRRDAYRVLLHSLRSIHDLYSFNAYSKRVKHQLGCEWTGYFQLSKLKLESKY